MLSLSTLSLSTLSLEENMKRGGGASKVREVLDRRGSRLATIC
jgi:hypothetical protein